MTSFVEEFRRDFLTSATGLVWVVLALWMGLSGPFGTYEALSFGLRLVYWGGTIAVGMLVGSGVRAFVIVAVAPLDYRIGALFSASLLSLISTPILYVFSEYMLRGRAPYVPNFFEVLAFVFSISLGVAAFRKTIASQPEQGLDFVEAAEAAPVERPLPRLLERLEPELRGDLISISVRDHYVDVQTSKGQGSLLMRLSDAIAEVGDVEGSQLHRSHWVAWAAVRGVEREAHKLFVLLPCGTRVPVSRNHREKLEARGLL